jgi:hypothetical protein
MLKSSFTFDRRTLDTPTLLPATFASQMLEAMLLVLPVMAVTAIVAILASGATGGFHFSLKSVAPKFSKLSPLEGIKRMLGTRAAVELLKSFAGREPQRIVYVSCDPATLARDVGFLCGNLGYALRAAGIANMFPHTSHVESIALLERAI